MKENIFIINNKKMEISKVSLDKDTLSVSEKN